MLLIGTRRDVVAPATREKGIGDGDDQDYDDYNVDDDVNDDDYVDYDDY